MIRNENEPDRTPLEASTSRDGGWLPHSAERERQVQNVPCATVEASRWAEDSCSMQHVEAPVCEHVRRAGQVSGCNYASLVKKSAIGECVSCDAGEHASVRNMRVW
jgi:hypothetical protein